MAKRKQQRSLRTLAIRPIPSRPADEQTLIDLIMGARLARLLGISTTTFWRWRKMEDFPTGRRIRNHVYFSRSAVLAWLDRQQQAA
jgi:predicted DNA-binding transcriptional regulator AlpA